MSKIILVFLLFFCEMASGQNALATSALYYRLRDVYDDGVDIRSNLRRPTAISVLPGEVSAVIDADSKTVVIFNKRWAPQKKLGKPRGEGSVSFEEPVALKFASADELWVLDSKKSKLMLIDLDGRVLKEVGSYGIARGSLKNPGGFCFGPDGKIYIADTGNNRIEIFSGDGRLESEWKGVSLRGTKLFKSPSSIVYSGDGDGFLWVSFENEPFLCKFDKRGIIVEEIDLKKFAAGSVIVTGLEIDKEFWRLLVHDALGNRALLISRKSELLAEVPFPIDALSGGASLVWGMNFFITDQVNRRILHYDRIRSGD